MTNARSNGRVRRSPAIRGSKRRTSVSAKGATIPNHFGAAKRQDHQLEVGIRVVIRSSRPVADATDAEETKETNEGHLRASDVTRTRTGPASDLGMATETATGIVNGIATATAVIERTYSRWKGEREGQASKSGQGSRRRPGRRSGQGPEGARSRQSSGTKPFVST